MPKQKTHSGAKKRFKVTGSGKLPHEQANRRHLLESKSSKAQSLMMGSTQIKKPLLEHVMTDICKL